MDCLYPWNEDHTEFSLTRGTCGCCGETHYSDPECCGDPITVEMLDRWERWLWEQIANVYKCRHIVESPMLMTTFKPSLDLAWEVAVMRARRLGQSWRGRDLPDTGVNNPVDKALSRIQEDFENSLDEDEQDKQVIEYAEENYQILSDYFFEFYTKEDD